MEWVGGEVMFVVLVGSVIGLLLLLGGAVGVGFFGSGVGDGFFSAAAKTGQPL